MDINSIQISNYKCFNNTDPVNLIHGINIITGKNNSGKTAFLESLSCNFINKPHLSEKIKPTPSSVILNSESHIIIDFLINRDELSDIIENEFNNKVHIPNSVEFMNYLADDPNFEIEVNNKLNDNILIQSKIGIEKTIESSRIYNYYKKHIEKTIGSIDNAIMQYRDGKYFIHQKVNTDIQHEFSYQLCLKFLERIYYFNAQRLHVSKTQFGDTDILEPNASNLPIVLNKLQTNPHRFQEYIKLVKEIFPDIKSISISPKDKELEILIWKVSPESERLDLTISLSECGTGISQVLAILYVVKNSDFPKIILIDEPQSFLHPGAIRKLIEIFKFNSQHQYIIATHSPIILSASRNSNIILLENNTSESVIKEINQNDNKQISILLSDIGTKLSDIFGCDYILWVEGKTEELVFPIIIDKLIRQPLMGTKIISVKNTGDFDSRYKYAEKTFDIYTKLSESSGGLIPTALSYIFDIDNKSNKEIEDLNRKSKGLVKFINRRLYENYLLNDKAILTVLREELKDDNNVEISDDDIKMWLDKNLWQDKYYNIDKHKEIMIDFLSEKGYRKYKN